MHLLAVKQKHADSFYKNRHLCVKNRNFWIYRNCMGKDEKHNR